MFDLILEHMFYSDGNSKRISWTLKTGDRKFEQIREHADIYFNKVTNEQSKYIALHVGIFWCVGTFLIKNGDIVNILIDTKPMYGHLSQNKPNVDSFIEHRTEFIRKLIAQRKLAINYKLIENNENFASKLLKERIGT